MVDGIKAAEAAVSLAPVLKMADARDEAAATLVVVPGMVDGEIGAAVTLVILQHANAVEVCLLEVDPGPEASRLGQEAEASRRVMASERYLGAGRLLHSRDSVATHVHVW